MNDIAQLKQALPLDRLMAKLGLFEHVQKKAYCPFHEDGTHSFSVVNLNGKGWHWHCYAGCGKGDEIDFLKVMFNLQTKQAIERYADLAGMGKCQAWDAVKRFQGKVVPFSRESPESAATAPIDTEHSQAGEGERASTRKESVLPAKLEPLSDEACIKIASWRGLDPKFLADMSDKGVIGLYDNKPAFSNGPGSVQYRLKDGTWRYSPAGSETTVLIIRMNDTSPSWFIVESQWDALALAESTSLNVICTRGAANARLALDYLIKSDPLLLYNLTIIPHNDEPGEKWLQDLKAGLMLHNLKVKRVPAAYKDFNEFYKFKKQQEKDWIGEGNNG